MPGHLLSAFALVGCAHGGRAVPTRPDTRVLVDGVPVTVAAPDAPYTVVGCPLPVQPGPGPCVSAQWTGGATRVRAGGLPVLLSDSRSVCTPTGTALTVLAVQARVRGV
ncbi:hypothetical protein ACFXDH_13960 [Streptomyces sp. NPDC059467]|uniref:hypothetical protein n=1 Tax=Streptomyces sp. NPDC059467 TaxID=3346844 RepID=UPI0036C63EA7